MNNSRHCLQFLLLLLVLALAGCATSAPPVSWQPAGEAWVFPFPPEQPRIRFLKDIAGVDALRDKSETGRRLFKWLGAEDALRMPMVSPYGVAADGQGRIWVSDPGSALVHAIDMSQQQIDYISVIGQRKLLSPAGAAYNPQLKRLYVTDTGLLEVLMFDQGNSYLGSFRPESGFGRPGGVTVDSAGDVYVADVVAGTIEIFTADGQHVKSLGSRVAPNKKFNRPTNIAVDSEGRIYVVDALRFRVEVLGLPGEQPKLIGGLGDVSGSFARPRGIALDSAGHIYVSDAAFDNIQVFNRQGQLLLVIGRGEKGPDQFCMPAGLSFDAFDRFYVADSCGYQVKIFEFLGE